jgi:hypothetical protein
MKSNPQNLATPKKHYIAPKLKKLGNIKNLTFKTGSQTDGIAIGRV